METSIAAAVATIVADAVMTPLDVVKQRLQLAGSPYKGTMDCITSTLRTEGVQAFFKSYNTTIIMNVPFVSIHFATYESCKKLLRKSPEDEGLVTQIIAGGVAGGAAAAATNPLDVVKTRLQTSGTQYNTSSSYAVLKSIVSKEGYGALMQGMRPRIVFHIPAAAISWVTYETCKKFLSV
uniref:Mitochondrial carrier protein n=1 Tax=Chloropicon laureae TaxID=464258 RepID=A0A7S2YZV5_9CHLO